jgi:CubicO group peptidase (beta-lactamase class C family)
LPDVKRRSLLSAVTFGLLAGAARGQAAGVLTGRWTGALAAGPQRLRLRFEIGADGRVTLYSLDQGGQPLPARLAATEPEVRIEAPSVQGRFEGRLAGPDRLEGVWIQGGGRLPLARARGGAPPPPAPVEPLSQARLERLRAQAGAPALAAALRRGDDPPTIWVTGEREAGSGSSATAADLWHLGSITKSMTATLVARLVDAGRVNWTDTLGEALGAAAPAMRPAYRSATFLHLLSHRAGLPANLPLDVLAGYPRAAADSRADRLRYLGKALAQAPIGPAERTFEYSNTGYVAAAAMLEARLGESWETLIRDWLFKPLGLATAGFGAPGGAGVLEQPIGHGPGPRGALTPYRPGDPVNDNPAVLGPAGRVHMSLPDLLTFLTAHRDRTALLTSDAWRKLHTPPFGGDYALGWIVRPDGALWHNGSNTLWYAEALVQPAQGIVAAAAANLAAAQGAVGEALAGAVAAG